MRTRTPARAADVQEAWVAMRQLWFDTMPAFAAIASEHGLTKPQAGALLRLDPDTPVPMSALAEALVCDASNVTGLIDRLEDRGLVERRDAPHDRRVRMLAMTDEGRRLRARLESDLGQPPAALLSLSAADQRALRDIMRRAMTGRV